MDYPMIDWGEILSIPSNNGGVKYRIIHVPAPDEGEADDIRSSLMVMNLAKWPIHVGLFYQSPGAANPAATSLGTQPHTTFKLLSDHDDSLQRGASGMLLDGRNLKAIRYIAIWVPTEYAMGASDAGSVNVMVWPQRWRIEAKT